MQLSARACLPALLLLLLPLGSTALGSTTLAQSTPEPTPSPTPNPLPSPLPTEAPPPDDAAPPELQAGLRSALYLDNDSNTIVTSVADVGARLDGRWQLGTRYVVDVVSSASVDVVTQATARFDETRHEVGATAGYRNDEGSALLAAYSHSTEHDWTSHNVSVGGSRDLLQRNLSLTGSLTFQDNTVTRVDTFGFSRKLRSYLATIGGAYTLSPRELAQLTLAGSLHDGYQASPYRYLKIDQFGYAEHVPEQRAKVALVGRYHRDLGHHTALQLHARAYVDSYRVLSATAGTRLAYDGGTSDLDGGSWDLAAFLRGYAQQHAWFYRGVYAEPQRHMTLDKELSSFWDIFAGLALGRTWRAARGTSELRFEARLAANHFTFLDYVWLRSRQGLTATLALNGRL